MLELQMHPYFVTLGFRLRVPPAVVLAHSHSATQQVSAAAVWMYASLLDFPDQCLTGCTVSCVATR